MPVRCPEAVACVYADVHHLVQIEAARFARDRGLDRDECEGNAALIFLHALRTHDPARSSVEQRVRYRVRRGLMTLHKTELARNRKHPRADLSAAAGLPARPDPGPFDRAGLLSRLGEDARTVVMLILESPAELAAAIRSEREPGAVTTRKCLRRFLLKSLGWARERVAETFDEIRGALSWTD